MNTACTALWTATLSLMAAYMQTPAPAHRLLLARRIARNFQTLAQEDIFSEATRASFARLHLRWTATATGLGRPDAGPRLLARLRPIGPQGL